MNKARGQQDVTAPSRAQEDRRLIDRCLRGEETAWEKLYYRCHPGLIRAVRYLLGVTEIRDPNLVEEIAARVWYLLLRDDARLLSRFDPERDCRLQAFLVGFARNEILQYLRAERRRRSHEATGGRLLLAGQRSSQTPVDSLLDEFASTLSQREQEFLAQYLLSPPEEESAPPDQDLSPTNVWQRRHRLRFKLKAFMRGG
ncbi:MAG: sigma-70 family RNA polymerase sigma factor [Pirellulales bacterium]|nr:sigma-70 family RNA polymerase sigma factor [Pirellulales bacterium]